MPETGIGGRVEWLERQHAEFRALFVELRGIVRDMEVDVSGLVAEVGRVPPANSRGDRKAITDRLHNLETIVTPTMMEAAVNRALDKRRASAWHWWQKAVVIFAAVGGMVEGLLRLFGVGGG